MALNNAVVLDLTGLETGSLAGAGAAIAQVQMCLSKGRSVIAIVATPADRAERDQAAANRLGATADPAARAATVASGAVDQAAVFAGVLTEAGLDAVPAAPDLWPTTRGHALDAEPRRVSANAFASALSEHDVLVVPGGVGRGDDGSPTSLGRNTAPLTALFLGDRLALPVERPRLGTDNDGNADNDLGLRKAARFIERTGVRAEAVSLADAGPIPGRARVAAFGGGETADLIAGWGTHLSDSFEFERFDATELGAEAARVWSPDVVIDFTNAADAAYDVGSWALRTGRTLITANTALLAERGGGLSIAALIGGGRLHASAAVRGCPRLAPVLARACGWPGVHRVQGSFSPLADRTLDLRSQGMSEAEAERAAAAELGLSDADVTASRSGEDAMTTLAAVAQLAFGAPAEVRANARGPEHVTDLDLARAAAQGRRYRVVATAERLGDQVALRVGPVPLREDDPLVNTGPGSVEAVVETRAGENLRASGRLQHPGSVAAAVLRDLIDARRDPSPARAAVNARQARVNDPILGVTA